MNLNIQSGFKTLKSVITANSPVLLAGAAVTGIVATAVLAAKGGYKARGIIDEAESERFDNGQVPLDTIDKVKLTWLCYAVPGVTAISSIASVAGVHLIHSKRHAALVGLYALSTAKLDDVSAKAEEMLGVKKSQQLRDDVAQQTVDRAGPYDNAEVVITGDGESLTFDEPSGRWFRSSMNKVEAAVNKLNQELSQGGNASLNDLYEYMHLDRVALGENVGWSGQMIEAKFGVARSPEGEPVNSVSFHPKPTHGYRNK